MSTTQTVILCILDGFGVGSGGEDDAIHTARMPNWRRLCSLHPHRTLVAHGTAVGLPTDGDMGNSEVGHNAMGAGRIFDQGAKLVEKALNSGAAFESDVWAALMEAGTLHLLGLVSDGNVHSHIDHLHQILDRAEVAGKQQVRVHLLTDGRDVEPRSALTWVLPLEARLQTARDSGLDWQIASGGGRMEITMDRYEADWAMVERGWAAHVRGEGERFSKASDAIQTFYDRDADLTDQTLPAFVITDNGEPVGRIVDGDGVLFTNFRGDRAVEITRAFEEEDFSGFPIPHRPDVVYAGMMQYDGDLMLPKRFLVAPPLIDEVVGEQLVRDGKHTLSVSETQKFGHVTFFFNGNRSEPLDPILDEWIEVPSDLASPATRPWMKAAEIVDVVLDALGRDVPPDHIRLNLANCDMVGHTGHLEAARVAAEAVDLQIGRLERAARDHDAILLITADHGNADEMYQHKGGEVRRDEAGAPVPKTSHTLHPVPFLILDPAGRATLTDGGNASIGHLGATVLTLLGVDVPDDYLPTLVTR